MTIDELLSLAGLTANDEIPVWDAEAADEPTKKIKAQNLAASVKALAGLVGEAEFTEVTESLADKASAIVDTASGAIASFPDGAAVPAKDITIGIELVQAGSGDPSPENVRPISGWTGANVTRTGFNVWDEEWEVGDINGSTGENESSSTNIRSKNYIRVLPNKSYYFCAPTQIKIRYYDRNKTFIRGGVLPNNIVITMSEQTGYIRFSMPNAYGTTYNHDICINLSDPAKNGTYEPGHVVTIPISWQSEAGTVYGGTLDVTTGLLTIDMAMVTFDGSTSSGWNGPTATYGTSTRFDYIAMRSTLKAGGNVVSNYLKTGAIGMSGAERCNVHGSIGDIIVQIHTDRLASADLSGLMGYFASHPLQIVAELATPQTYQLTPTEVEMLLGENNVWADTGDSIVIYRADTKLYIQKINAPTDDDMIADAQIASGRYFIIGGNLYRSTTTIPAGDAINPGSNCIMTNLADALNALNT